MIFGIVAVYLQDTGTVSGTAWQAYGRERNIGNILTSCSGHQVHSSA